MSDNTKELTVDEELDMMMGHMFSVRSNQPKKEEPVADTDKKTVVSKQEKSRAKDARRKSKQGR